MSLGRRSRFWFRGCESGVDQGIIYMQFIRHVQPRQVLVVNSPSIMGSSPAHPPSHTAHMNFDPFTFHAPCCTPRYILLCGWPPFHGENTQQIFKHIMSQPLDLKSDPWPRISDAAKDCVRKMLARDPRKRLTAEQVGFVVLVQCPAPLNYCTSLYLWRCDAFSDLCERLTVGQAKFCGFFSLSAFLFPCVLC